MSRALAAMFSRRWLLTTLLVLAGSAVCVRLGLWQLDRLAQRREFNAHVTAMTALPALDLNAAHEAGLTGMEYRAARATGSYAHDFQVALRNQYHDGQLGFHLLTPLLLDDGRAVLVDRGWIPADGNARAEDWRRYDEPGPVSVTGLLRLGGADLLLGSATGIPSGSLHQDFWNTVDLAGVAAQTPYRTLPVYLQPDVQLPDDSPPIPFQPEIQLSEGPHLGYAGQWFIFAGLLLFGYPFFYLRRRALQ
jgi:surfeit locus 1 family protein